MFLLPALTLLLSLCLQGPVKRAGAMFTIGVVGRCLSKALVQSQSLTPKCRELVLIAAPKDSRVYLQYPESASALVQKIAELQRAAGEICRRIGWKVWQGNSEYLGYMAKRGAGTGFQLGMCCLHVDDPSLHDGQPILPC